MASETSAVLDLVRRLQSRRAARQRRLFIEGVRNVTRASERQLDAELMLVCRTLLISRAGRDAVRRYQDQGVPLVHLSPEQFRSISTLPRASGIGAVIRTPWARLQGKGCWLAVERLRSRGNLGTLMRTADAAGARGVLVIGPHVDPFHPDVVRASMGAALTLDVAPSTYLEIQQWARATSAMIVGATPAARRPYDQVTYADNVVLILGDERKGLTRAQEQLCKTRVRIPMKPGVDSLNVAVAGSLLLYEIRRSTRTGDSHH